MNYQLLNKAFEDIYQLRQGRILKKVDTSKIINCDANNGTQSESDVITEIYEFEDKFLKLIFHTDSYGDNESLNSIQICEKVTKPIEIYEPINS